MREGLRHEKGRSIQIDLFGTLTMDEVDLLLLLFLLLFLQVSDGKADET